MPTILALNPCGTRTNKKKGRTKMSKKKGKKRRSMTPLQIKYFGTKRQRAALATKKKPAAKKTASQKKESSKMAKGKKGKKKISRKNPKVAAYAGRTLAGINIFGAVKSGVPLLFGALCAKFAAKKFAEGGSESDNWTYKNYLLALAGGFVAAFGTSAILKKRAAAQKVFEGALLLVGYKIFTGEIAPKNASLESWFGQTDFDPYGSLGAVNGIGDIWQSGSSNYVRGVDGYWRPADESHRLPASRSTQSLPAFVGDVLVDPSARYGDVLVDPSSRYGETPSAHHMAKAIDADGM